VRALRERAPDVPPSAPPRPLPRPAEPGPAENQNAIALLDRAIALRADAVITTRAGRTIRLLPTEIDRAASGTRLRGTFLDGDPVTGAFGISLGEIARVEIFLGTARDVGRNAPCPCGSRRKFKRCCQGDDRPLARA
jgi:hypothetical protein